MFKNCRKIAWVFVLAGCSDVTSPVTSPSLAIVPLPTPITLQPVQIVSKKGQTWMVLPNGQIRDSQGRVVVQLQGDALTKLTDVMRSRGVVAEIKRKYLDSPQGKKALGIRGRLAPTAQSNSVPCTTYPTCGWDETAGWCNALFENLYDTTQEFYAAQDDYWVAWMELLAASVYPNAPSAWDLAQMAWLSYRVSWLASSLSSIASNITSLGCMG